MSEMIVSLDCNCSTYDLHGLSFDVSGMYKLLVGCCIIFRLRGDPYLGKYEAWVATQCPIIGDGSESTFFIFQAVNCWFKLRYVVSFYM